MSSSRVAGLSMKGGRRDNFFFCLLDHYKDGDRWFLKSLLQVEDEEGHEDGDDAIRSWIENYEIENIVVDFPLSRPPCHDCELECPGINRCPMMEVQYVHKETKRILSNDQELSLSRPKDYERKRNEADLIHPSKDLFEKLPVENILSKTFKRRLKKGFLPYWNRSLDFWIWCFYHDQLLNLFNSTFDSFGNTSLMMISRFSYLKRHFPAGLNLNEANVNLALIELIRAGVLLRKDIVNMGDFEVGVEARLDIIKKIETKLNIFIYDHDLDILAKRPRAFESFMLAVAGQRKLLGKNVELPEWTLPENTKFILPQF
jgi:hypothetical protein